MKSFTRKMIRLATTCALMVAMQGTFAQSRLPNPILVFVGQETAKIGGKEMIRYTFDVFNKDAYPAEMFAAAPSLPPCGTNTKAARTWVDIFNQRGERLMGFCALGTPSDLGKIHFSLPVDVVPPSWVYIELNDRQTSTKYKSNLAETVL